MKQFENDLRNRRSVRGWSQEQLARLSGISRAGISAIETDRLIPSAAAALALAAALECRVEDIFRLRGNEVPQTAWAWPPRREPCRFWKAEVGGSIKLYPVEATGSGVLPHDGLFLGGPLPIDVDGDPEQTLMMACCDPAVGLLAAELARVGDVRLIAFPRSSRTALSLVGRGLVHVAGIHLSRAEHAGGNAAVVRRELGGGYNLLRVTRWEEGIAFAPGLRLASVRQAVDSNLRWIGREDGSGARQCLDELFGNRRPPRRLASDNRGVAEAVRSGWADAGVCLRLVSEEAGLDFLPVREEFYDLCFPDRWEGDYRIQALLQVVRSRTYRKAVGELPEYDNAQTGDLQRIVDGLQ
jgi:molybdate-binding protein/transcriptional regulator with XRE-family HTH domain